MLASTFYLIVGLSTGGLLVAGAGAAVIASVTRQKRQEKRMLAKYVPKRSRALPTAVQSELEGLRKDLEVLLTLEEFGLASRLSGIIELAQDFFGRLKKRGNEHQLRMAALSYGNILGKLNKALSDEYFFDMKRNPELWTRVQEREALVHKAVEAIHEEFITAIRDFNARADILFDVDMESILRKSNASELLEDLR